MTDPTENAAAPTPKADPAFAAAVASVLPAARADMAPPIEAKEAPKPEASAKNPLGSKASSLPLPRMRPTPKVASVGAPVIDAAPTSSPPVITPIEAPAATSTGDARRLALAASLALGVALGGFGAAGTMLFAQRGTPTTADWHRIAGRLDGGGSDVGRFGAELKALKDGFAALKEASDRGRSDAGARFAQMGERFERLQKTEQEVSGRVSSLGERLDRADKDEVTRLSALGDRIEKRLAAAPIAAQASAKIADPVQTGSLTDTKPVGSVLSTWAVREVYDGVAMLENRNQRLLEVAPGATIPGVGRVEAIERRGKAWVVVTAKGVITTQAW